MDPKIDQHLLLQSTHKFTQIWIFELKIYNLATLINTGQCIHGYEPPYNQRGFSCGGLILNCVLGDQMSL
jgi:hypothetical protein